MEKFDELINSPIPVLVDFFATWCGPCKMMHPVLEELKKIKGETVRIAKIDVDTHEQLAGRYNIQTVPTLMIFKNGELLWKQSGAMQLKALKETIEKFE